MLELVIKALHVPNVRGGGGGVGRAECPTAFLHSFRHFRCVFLCCCIARVFVCFAGALLPGADAALAPESPIFVRKPKLKPCPDPMNPKPLAWCLP